MKNKYEIERELEKIIYENELYVDYLMIDESKKTYPITVLRVEIEGDWKHEHLKLDAILEKEGYVLIDKVFAEEPMEDFYSCEHIYLNCYSKMNIEG